jgi:hypothetical protein
MIHLRNIYWDHNWTPKLAPITSEEYQRVQDSPMPGQVDFPMMQTIRGADDDFDLGPVAHSGLNDV